MPTTRRAARLLVASIVAAALAAAPAAAEVLTAEQVVERNATARGGRAAWRKIESMTWAGRVESAAWGGRRAPFVLEQKRPDRTRFEVTLDGQKAIRAWDGKDGWKLRAAAGSRPEVQGYTADEAAFARGAPVIEGPLMDHAARGATISLLGLQALDGRSAYVLGLRLASGSSYRVWIDAETFLERRYDCDVVDAQGRTTTTSVRFDDYRAVEGVQLPFTIESGTQDGRRDKLVIERIAVNAPLDDGEFARPGPAVRRRGVTVDTRAVAPARAARPE
jgi:hypothetical protein